MYLRRLEVRNLRSVDETAIDFVVPEAGDGRDNVSLILGDNGAGKTTILGAVAMGCLAPVLDATGFRPYRLIRRPRIRERRVVEPGFVRVDIDLHQEDGFAQSCHGVAALEIKPLGSFEKPEPLDVHEPNAVSHDGWEELFEDRGTGFLLLGYGTTRRTDRSDSFDPSAVEKNRALRYHRVAGLFEDHLALTPLSAWLPKIWRSEVGAEIVALVNATLPPRLRLTDIMRSERRRAERSVVFEADGDEVPFWALSDGYRAFVGLVGDILYHLWRTTKGRQPLREAPGVVLIDEIDLHLHPSWQRTVVARLSRAFPHLQFIITTHSAIVAGTVPHERLVVLERTAEAGVVARAGTERIYGRSADQILLSGYFGLDTTRAPGYTDELRKLGRRAVAGDDVAAVDYLRALARPAPDRDPDELEHAASVAREATEEPFEPLTTPKKKATKKKATKKATKKKATKKKATKKKR